MRDLGYIVTSRILDARDFGVPQHRRRVFFVGRLPGWSFEWPLPTHGDGRAPPVTVWEAIGDLPALEAGGAAGAYIGPPHSPYAASMRVGAGCLTNHEAPRHPPATIDRIARTAPGEPMYARFRQRIRLHPDRPSPTIVSGGIRPQCQYGHPTQPRGLTVREQARLQSFPDRYHFEGGTTQGRVQTGDAVPPLLATRIAERIASGLVAGTTG
jgi:DNA (cytosine-5)-methyltransferase 1